MHDHSTPFIKIMEAQFFESKCCHIVLKHYQYTFTSGHCCRLALEHWQQHERETYMSTQSILFYWME